MSNAWVTYPGHRDNIANAMLIPDDTSKVHIIEVKGFPAWEGLTCYQLVGEVTAHQGYDG